MPREEAQENMRQIFERERLEVLRTLDEEKIRNFFKKWNPSDGLHLQSKEVFWRAIYLGILKDVKDAPDELKNKARQWLHERGIKAIEEPEKSKIIIPQGGFGKTNLPI